MYSIYSLLLGAGMLVTTPYWLLKAIGERKYFANFRQRLGFALPKAVPFSRPVWIHAVSVGEVLAAKPLYSAIRRARPEIPVVVSTVTLTGQELARKELRDAALILFFPFDWRFSVGRFLSLLAPRAVVLLETELWPNFLRSCGERGIPVFLANGRLSEESYRRYRRIGGLTRAMLGAVQVIAAQTPEDARRFIALGAESARVRTTGNLKYDFPTPTTDRSSAWMQAIAQVLGIGGQSPVVVVGSSMKGEEEIIISAFREVRSALPGVRLILAPRHPERFAEVSELLERSGIPFARRTALDAVTHRPEILLLDSIGELRSVYTLASVAVIGGSILPEGKGHNLLEPAALGKAVVIGPGMSNFREMESLFVRAQAVRQCSTDGLAAAVIELLNNSRARRMLGERAALTCRQNQGAAENTLLLLAPALG